MSIEQLHHRGGRVVAVHGSVIDVAFPNGALPGINEASAIDWDLGESVIAEVQQHVGPAIVRAVALRNTAGLRRGIVARALGQPVQAPVGEAVLGRLLNAMGRPADRGPAFASDTAYWPIHAPSPPLERQTGTREMFHTGISR